MVVSVALGNLAYLIGIVVLGVLGGLAVVLLHRKPKSVEANVNSFHRGLRALAPDSASPDRPAGHVQPFVPRGAPEGAGSEAERKAETG